MANTKKAETPEVTATTEKLKTVTLKATAVIKGIRYFKGDKLEVTAEKEAELKELKLI